MTLMRTAGSTTPVTPRVIRAAGGDGRAAEQDAACAEAARREAVELLERARQEADDIRRRAHEEGLAAGVAAAENLSQARGDQAAPADSQLLAELVQRIEQQRSEWLARWERNIVQLAVAIAQRVVRREVQAHPDLGIELVREALELAAGCAHLRLRLHPDDLAAFGGPIRQLAQQLGRVTQAELVADASLERGECHVSTDHGEIDQRFATQLVRLTEELI
jgi:flagellar assembly protein FliH